MKKLIHAYHAALVYALIVIVCYALDFWVYVSFVKLDVNIYFANVLAFCVGTVAVVILVRRYVFKQSRFNFTKDLSLTIVANGSMLALSLAIFYFLVELPSVKHHWAKLLSSGVTFGLNYLSRAIIFSRN